VIDERFKKGLAQIGDLLVCTYAGGMNGQVTKAFTEGHVYSVVAPVEEGMGGVGVVDDSGNFLYCTISRFSHLGYAKPPTKEDCL